MGELSMGAEDMARHPTRARFGRVILLTTSGTVLFVFLIFLRMLFLQDRPRPRGAAASVLAADLSKADHLIMVAGHAVLTTLDLHEVRSESSWYLQPAQRGQLGVYLRHIEEGVRLAGEDSRAILMFSGGQTRPEAGPRSEALSYWLAAEAQDWFSTPAVRGRTLLEEGARDSFENLLFSLCRFREVVGAYPSKVTVVSYGYKRHRFADLHRSAVRFPEPRFRFVGVDPPSVPFTDTANVKHFSADPYGCQTNRDLRRQRNPYRRAVPYGEEDSCPEMHELLHFCGPGLFPERKLPWGVA
eukprot:Hpha_TRINITY_DN19149_c0_g1::TRINITY_DN19149_c0_g1_i1::g.94882::m.94882